MARAYDDDLRRKIFETHGRGQGSFRKLAEVFGVSLGYVEKIFRQRAQSGQIERVRHRPGPKRRIDAELDRFIVAFGRPAFGHHHRRGAGTDRARPRCSAGLVHRPARDRRARVAAQKKSIHATERDTEANLERRRQFVETIRSVPAERLIYLDESGLNTSMTRLYGRCRGGGRVAEATPGGHWKILTVLGAMSTRGMVAAMTIEEPTAAISFSLISNMCSRLRCDQATSW